MGSEYRVFCDRCRAGGAHEGLKTDRLINLTWWSGLLLTFSQTLTKKRIYDLCPECLKEFDEWIEKGPSK